VSAARRRMLKDASCVRFSVLGSRFSVQRFIGSDNGPKSRTQNREP
jgi:hypothetical protein